MVSKFKSETGTSQLNFKDHADPVLVCKPARDGSMIATGAADHVVSKNDFHELNHLTAGPGGFAANFEGSTEVCQGQSGAAWPLCSNYRSNFHK